MAGRPGFFDADERLKALSVADDPLKRLSKVADFEVFREDLEAALVRSDRAKGGRPPYDAVIMFKVLVQQTLYTPSDDATEYQLKDRLSFMRFCGLAAARCGAGCQDDLALSRAADAGWRAATAVRAL
jgi:transposase, IS5 family